MKNNVTELVFILDKSGSMYSLTEDTIGGFNSLIAKQRGQEGECLVSAVLFSSESSVLYDRVPLEKIPEMTRKDYVAQGCTALIDAIGDAVHHIGNIYKYARAEDVPAHTVFVIITDGMENASQRYSAGQVREMIGKKKAEGWEFLFIGANIDAVETAAHFGIDRDRAVDYCADKQGTKVIYNALAESVSCLRAEKKLSEEWSAPIRADYMKRKKN